MNRTHKSLWTVQILLAALFLYGGGLKLAMPAVELAKVSPFPVWFLRFIGVAECAGALGLVLPGLTRIATWLTPLAAAGLTVIMIGATIVTVQTASVPAAGFPFVVGLLTAFVAWGRTRVAPLVRPAA